MTTTVKKPRKSRKISLSETPDTTGSLLSSELVLLDDAPHTATLKKNEYNKWRNATKSGDKSALDAIDMTLVESSQEYEKFMRRVNRINKADAVIEPPTDESPPFEFNNKPQSLDDDEAAAYFVEQASEPIWETKLKVRVFEFNARYALVLNGNKSVVMKSTLNADGRLERAFLTTEHFVKLHMNYRIKTGVTEKGKDVYESEGMAWLQHNKRAQYIDGIVFEPSRYTNGIEVKKQIYGNRLNLWQGYSVQPIQGERGALERIYYHIKSVICNDDDACIEYLLNWIARCLQYPEKTGQVATVLKGEKGCGKGTLGNFIKNIFGQHGLQVTNAKHLVGHFNAHLADCCFLFADEAFFAGDKQHENILKTLITEATQIIERKGVDAVSMANRLKILMASNSDWVAPATKDERRYFVLEVSSEHIGDADYFTALHKDINNPDIQAAFLFDMLHRDISKFNVGKVPDTKALQHQREQSLDSFCRYWIDALQRGYLYQSQHGLDALHEWIAEPSVELIRRGYVQWCNTKKTDQHRIITDKKMGSYLTAWYSEKKRKLNACGLLRGETVRGEADLAKGQTYCYVIGTQIEASRLFCEHEKLDVESLI